MKFSPFFRFTNNTFIPGNPTLEPEDMYDNWTKGKKKTGPFSAPGSAPIFGEGCGVNGGNPNGCIGEGIGYYITYLSYF